MFISDTIAFYFRWYKQSWYRHFTYTSSRTDTDTTLKSQTSHPLISINSLQPLLLCLWVVLLAQVVVAGWQNVEAILRCLVLAAAKKSSARDSIDGWYVVITLPETKSSPLKIGHFREGWTFFHWKKSPQILDVFFVHGVQVTSLLLNLLMLKKSNLTSWGW